MRSRGWASVIVVAALLGLMTLGVILISGTQQDATFPPDTPEAAFQRYAAAWDAGSAHDKPPER